MLKLLLTIPLGRRRLAAAWDSDDDEESLASYQRMEVARRHAAETLFGGGYDDERSTAVLRSAMAAAKRLPTKEALDSLESVKVADLKDADRSKLHICVASMSLTCFQLASSVITNSVSVTQKGILRILSVFPSASIYLETSV